MNGHGTRSDRERVPIVFIGRQRPVAEALGTVGFEDRVDYAVIGPVTNLAARLCAAARGGEVLVSAGVRDALGERLSAQAIGSLRLKGFRDPAPAYRAQPVESPAQVQTQAEQRLEELT